MEYTNHLFNNLHPESFDDMEFVAPCRFGEVFKTTYNQDPSKFYAIKRIRISPNNKEEQAFIQQEIEILTKIQSQPQKPKSIPEFHGHYISSIKKYKSSDYCLTMDYFPTTLRALIKQYQTDNSLLLPFQQLLDIFKDLMNGITFLQTLNISHRDLKPENMMLDDENKVKIVDFGLATDISKVLDSEEEKQEPNKPLVEVSQLMMTIGGTKPYMAPEILQGLSQKTEKNPRNSFKSDAFSFGLIMMELGNMELLKREGNQAKWEETIKNKLKLMRRNYSKKITDQEKKELKVMLEIIEACTKYEPKERPDFIEIFGKWLGGENPQRIKLHVLIQDYKLEEMNYDVKNAARLAKQRKEMAENIEVLKEENRRIHEELSNNLELKKKYSEDFGKISKENEDIGEKMDLFKGEIQVLKEENEKLHEELISNLELKKRYSEDLGKILEENEGMQEKMELLKGENKKMLTEMKLLKNELDERKLKEKELLIENADLKKKMKEMTLELENQKMKISM